MNSIDNLKWRYAVKKFDHHKILSDNQINILAITTSEIKISVLVEQKYSELAVRGLHKEFKLGN